MHILTACIFRNVLGLFFALRVDTLVLDSLFPGPRVYHTVSPANQQTEPQRERASGFLHLSQNKPKTVDGSLGSCSSARDYLEIWT